MASHEECFHQHKERLFQHGLHVKSDAPIHHSTLRRASILVLLASDGHILLTQRSMHLRSHPGEVCFPGGKQDGVDQGDDWKTALRETKEEVGLDLERIEPAGERVARLRTLESLGHLCVTPLVLYCHQTSPEISSWIQINPMEVDHYFWVPLHFFHTTPPALEYNVPWQGETFVFRKYLFGPNQIPITGLTAHVAREVADIAFGTNLDNATTMGSSGKLDPFPSQDDFQGILWRRRDDWKQAARTSPWCQRYFILCDNMLHQYDNEQMAERKSHAAMKKHRLKLDDSIQVQDEPIDDDHSGKLYPFSISVLDGRIVWFLAAATSHQRSTWKKWLVGSVKPPNQSA